MSTSSSSLFPFDGECTLSRGADIAIKFSEGAPLKAHSQHLKEASAVLRTALEECRHDGTLDAGDDNREAWVLLLNLVHPGRRISGPGRFQPSMVEQMLINGALASKYDVRCLLDYVDDALCRAVDDSKAELEPTEESTNDAFTASGTLYKYSGVALELGLEKTKDALLCYFGEAMKGLTRVQGVRGFQRTFSNEGFLFGSSPQAEYGRPVSPTAMGSMIAQYVSFLSSKQDYKFACAIAEVALYSAPF